MKKIFVIILLLSVSFFGFSQQDTTKENKDQHINVFTAVSFGQNYYGRNYFTNTFGVNYSEKVSNKVRLRVGASIFNYDGATLVDKAPRRHKDASLYAGLDYKVNENLMLSGTIFFNTIYSTLAANLNMQYKFNDDTFLDVSFTYIKGYSPYSYEGMPIYNSIYNPIYNPIFYK